MTSFVGFAEIKFGAQDGRVGVALAAANNIVDAAAEHVAKDARGDLLVDDAGVDGGAGGGPFEGLVMGDSIFRDDLAKLVDGCLIDKAVWGHAFRHWRGRGHTHG